MSERPDLTVCIPTIGRPGLDRTLRSLTLQDGYDPAAVELLVVGDGHADHLDGRRDALDAARETSARHGARYAEHDGGCHAWGHPQRNAAMALARGAWLWFLADDDMATDDALTIIRAATAEMPEPGPLLFRVHHWVGRPIWTFSELVEGNIDAECIVVPNDHDRLGWWTDRYEGDYDFIVETVGKWGGRLDWRRAFVAITRPTHTADWTTGLTKRVPA